MSETSCDHEQHYSVSTINNNTTAPTARKEISHRCLTNTSHCSKANKVCVYCTQHCFCLNGRKRDSGGWKTGVRFQAGLDFFLRLLYRGSWASSFGAKRPQSEADPQLQRMRGDIPPPPPHAPAWRGAWLSIGKIGSLRSMHRSLLEAENVHILWDSVTEKVKLKWSLIVAGFTASSYSCAPSCLWLLQYPFTLSPSCRRDNIIVTFY